MGSVFEEDDGIEFGLYEVKFGQKIYGIGLQKYLLGPLGNFSIFKIDTQLCNLELLISYFMLCLRQLDNYLILYFMLLYIHSKVDFRGQILCYHRRYTCHNLD